MDESPARALAPHTHASPEAHRVADRGAILLCESGSTVHGTDAGTGQGDTDVMGICLEPAEHLTGLARVPGGPGWDGHQALVTFEQFEYHTVWEREGGHANRSGAGDLDLTVYSARKWARLALGGNPSVLLPLFVPDADLLRVTDAGRVLRANAHRFASRLAAPKFAGYMNQQRLAITGEAKGRNNRHELVRAHGYDCKSASHALRLGVQGREYLTTGRITLPMPEPERSRIRAVRRGEVPLGDALAWFDELDAALRETAADCPLPAEPDYGWVDRWLGESHLAFWRDGSDVSGGYPPLLPDRPRA